MQLEHKNYDRFVLNLFLCIILTLTPIMISTLIIPGFNASAGFTLLVGAAYMVEVIIVFFYYLVKQRGFIRINKYLFILAGLFTMSQSLTLLISSFEGIDINSYDLINIFVRFISIFLLISIPYQLFISQKGLEKFMSLIVLLGLAACLYNILVNYQGILNILNISDAYEVDFKSFYLNRNSFAQLLVFAVIANTVLFFKKKSFSNLLFYLVFFMNLFTTLSRTAAASVFLFLFLFAAANWRKKIVSRFFLLLSMISVVVFLFLNKTIIDFVTNIFLRTEAGTTGRIDLWEKGVDFLSQSNWMFGMGYLTSKDLLKVMGHDQFHSFYIETLVGGGIVELVLHVFVFLFVLSRIVVIMKHDRDTGTVYMAAFIALLFYGMFESISFFSMGYVDTIFTIFFMTIPILYANNWRKHKTIALGNNQPGSSREGRIH